MVLDDFPARLPSVMSGLWDLVSRLHLAVMMRGTAIRNTSQVRSAAYLITRLTTLLEAEYVSLRVRRVQHSNRIIGTCCDGFNTCHIHSRHYFPPSFHRAGYGLCDPTDDHIRV